MNMAECKFILNTCWNSSGYYEPPNKKKKNFYLACNDFLIRIYIINNNNFNEFSKVIIQQFNKSTNF